MSNQNLILKFKSKLAEQDTKLMEELEYIDKEVRKFTEDNPFPNYNEMEDLFDSPKNPDLKYYAFMWRTEYGEVNHECLKKMYESHLDEHVCKEMGKKIYKRGGFVALQACYYIMFHFSPYRLSNDRLVRFYPEIVQHHWNGIGEWQA